MDSEYRFNISLSVLNHLGRNLYRNFITIIGEAISNSWDADAEHVWIEIRPEKSEIVVRDDGAGMTRDDFQNKFLRVGYSKRKTGRSRSKRGRPFIGRKGIGKLALLSCSKEVIIITKTGSTDWTGGIINNSDLDSAIDDDVDQNEYCLKKLSREAIEDYCSDMEHGTVLVFNKTNADVPISNINSIRKLIALYFRFSLIDEAFSICVNDSVVGVDDLSDLINKTQFLWVINGGVNGDELAQVLNNSVMEVVNLKTDNKLIKGFIASTEKPRDLAIFGSGERVGIDLFVNGRMRERDISRHTPKSRIPENYLYGQIHYDELDSGSDVDRFTSSREGVVANDNLFRLFMKDFDKVLKRIINRWDKLRLDNNDDGDPNNGRKDKKQRASHSLFNEVVKEYRSNNVSIVNNWQKRFAEEAEFNFASYAECFVSENLVREFIRMEKYKLDDKANKQVKKWYDRELNDKQKAGISFMIRANGDDLYYLPMEDLCRVASRDRGGFHDKLTDYSISMLPIRNAVMHTSKLTDDAKLRLTSVFCNIRAKIGQLIDSEQQGS